MEIPGCHRKELNGAYTPEDSNYKQFNNTISNMSSFSTKESSNIQGLNGAHTPKESTSNHSNNSNSVQKEFPQSQELNGAHTPKKSHYKQFKTQKQGRWKIECSLKRNSLA